MRAVPPQPSGRMGVAADLFVACRRRCSGIDSSSLRDLGSQAHPQKNTYFWDRTLRLDRRALHPDPRRSQREPRDFHHGLKD